MLSIPRLRNVLKKLEMSSDLAKFLIQRATAVAGTINKDYASAIENPPNVTSSSSGATVSSLSKTLPPPSTTVSSTHTFTKTTSSSTSTSTSTRIESDLMYTTEQEKQPKAIAAAVASVSLFSGVESNSGVVKVLPNDNSNLRERIVVSCANNSHHNTNQHHQNQTSAKIENYNMSDAKVKEMTQPEDNKPVCNGASCDSEPDQQHNSCVREKPCFNSSLADILRFMELVGNLKHTKRTGWVLRDVNDCESISGHMYRMSMMTFLLDGSEGLNQIRCMELALVHDLAESLVGDLTPFCGVAKEDKKQMELKAMQDICKLIEPRGKRIMELFEEYEEGESAESKFVKDLDRLDMVMQAFEYEKRDNCLMKHQEFFDSTEGKFQHPFIQKLVKEIYDQRKALAEAKVVANGNLKLKTVTPNCPPCLEHKNARS